MKKIIFILFFFFLISCQRWNVDSLKREKVAFFKNGNRAGDIKIKIDNYALENLSFSIGVNNNKIWTVDNEEKRIQIFDSGDLELVLGDLKNIDLKKYKAEKFKFQILGSVVIDEDGIIYVQNRLMNNKVKIRGKEKTTTAFSPSYILVFNKKGELQYTLGQQGITDIPFHYIESLNVDTKGRLFVISRSFNSWSLFRFNGKKRDFYVNLKDLKLIDNDDGVELKGKIEDVKTYKNGEKIILSVAYYSKLRLKYIKIYEYSIKFKKIVRTIINIPDPKNVLFDIMDDSFIYLWNMDDDEVKFIICNMMGNIINNVKLDVIKKRSYYSKIINDNSGVIYSYQTTKKGVELFRWE